MLCFPRLMGTVSVINGTYLLDNSIIFFFILGHGRFMYHVIYI